MGHGRRSAKENTFPLQAFTERELEMTNPSGKKPRVLVVEDEYLIRMLVEDMLDDLGYGLAAAVGTIAEASDVAANGDFQAAILDVNLDGQEIYPVADILAERGLPFVFVTGYGERSLREPYRGRPALQKPFQAEQLKSTLAGILAPAA
jgi:CheY-like chemotaxis protein